MLVDRSPDRCSDACPQGYSDRDRPTTDQNADRCTETRADGDTDAQVLIGLPVCCRITRHRDLLPLRIASVDCPVACEQRRRSRPADGHVLTTGAKEVYVVVTYSAKRP